MAINVRYAPDYRYSQSQSQRSNFRPEDEEQVNPYAMSAGDGARVNSRLRTDRERLGQKQKKKYGEEAFKDTEAGFDWQAPIQIYDPAGNYQTGYESLGPDPLRTGGFGRLGTRETKIYDQAGVIDLNDPRDNALVGQIAQKRGGYYQDLNADQFRSPEEMRQIEEDRGFRRFEREQTLRNEMAGKLDEEQYKRTSERDATKRAAADAEFQQREDIRVRKLESQAGAALPENYGPEGELPEWKRRRLDELRAKYEEVRTNPAADRNEREGVFAQIVKEAEDLLKPNPIDRLANQYGAVQTDASGVQYQMNQRTGRMEPIRMPTTADQRLSEFAEKQKIIAAERVASEGRMSQQQALALADQAADNVYRYTGRQPTEQEIATEIGRLQGASKFAQVLPEPSQYGGNKVVIPDDAAPIVRQMVTQLKGMGWDDARIKAFIEQSFTGS